MVVDVPRGCGHCVINTGQTSLIFFAMYSAQASYDYERVRQEGFGLRVKETDDLYCVRCSEKGGLKWITDILAKQGLKYRNFVWEHKLLVG
ncbi:glucose-6-phosphate isomerase family protein [Thermofilum sp.]|uniref:glucose-6-phosphate isomerase family protein n=1 Tax=Thermofilum sp. TaxID=1961369 RepID=UPI00386526AF